MRDNKLREYLGLVETTGGAISSLYESFPDKINMIGYKQKDIEDRLRELTLKFNALLDFFQLETTYSVSHYKIERKQNERDESKGNKKGGKTTVYSSYTR